MGCERLGVALRGAAVSMTTSAWCLRARVTRPVRALSGTSSRRQENRTTHCASFIWPYETRRSEQTKETRLRTELAPCAATKAAAGPTALPVAMSSTAPAVEMVK
jgi:hypothetical protein